MILVEMKFFVKNVAGSGEKVIKVGFFVVQELEI
jgi:hypothetical protein